MLFCKLKEGDLIAVTFFNKRVVRFPFLSGEKDKGHYIMLVGRKDGFKNHLYIPLTNYYNSEYVIPDDLLFFVTNYGRASKIKAI